MKHRRFRIKSLIEKTGKTLIAGMFTVGSAGVTGAVSEIAVQANTHKYRKLQKR